MIEEKDIPEENFKENEMVENISPPKSIEQNEIQTEASDITTSEIKEMEVHHHPHVEKKSFKEYFLEFIMIFLAVTLGFFAESLREHVGDRDKEKEYLSSMVSELQYDTAKYKEITKAILYLRPVLDSLYINAKEAKRFNYVLQGKWNTPVNEQTTTYQPSLTTIEQLKSSGNLRLIDDKELANKIIGYAAFVQNRLLSTRVADMTEAVNNVFDQEDAISDERDFNNKVDDNMLHRTLPANSALFDMTLIVRDSVTLNKLANSYINLKARNYGYSIVISQADSLATELIQLINNKYHFIRE